jgi:hypothetical protein
MIIILGIKAYDEEEVDQKTSEAQDRAHHARSQP